MNDTKRRNTLRVKAKVKIRFKNVDAFISEYTHNISRGGLFVRTNKPCANGTMVEVVLVMPDTGKEISAISEVIHVVTPETATKDHPVGMGLHIKDISSSDQELIEELIKKHLTIVPPGQRLGRRKHERHQTKIRVRFGSLEAMLDEYSHNISHGGIFIRTVKPKKINERLKIILTHPETGEEMILDGEVVRTVSEDDAKKTGQSPGMGVKFLAKDKYTQDQLQAFITSTYQQGTGNLEVEES